MKAPSSKLFTCLIDDIGEEEAFVQVYWARAEHIGDALEKMLEAARLNGLQNPEPRQLDPYDFEEPIGDVEPGADAETFWAVERCYFDPEPLFIVPYGVISSCMEGDHDIEEIAPGFTRKTNDRGMTTIEVNVERDDLFELYSHLLRRQDTYRVFWYLLHDHWGDTRDHFLTNESLDTPEAILSHLVENELDSLLNGYVTLTAYCEEGATNLNISDHKRIIIHTYSDEMADDYASALDEVGYPEVDELVSIEYGIHHWHFRHPVSRTRDKLVEHLYSQGFSDWSPKK